jgi:hypothetical protein
VPIAIPLQKSRRVICLLIFKTIVYIINIAAVTLGYIGISYHVLVAMMLVGIVDLPAIHGYLEVTFNLIVIVVIAMGFHFKAALAAAR